MNDIIRNERIVDPFFEECFNQIFLQSDKTLFAMDGAVGTGKTSEFTVRSAYNLSCLVSPIRKGPRMVRESKWAFIRQSEQSAYNTVRGIFNEAIFSPEIVAAKEDLLTIHGQHPKELHVMHDLADGTVVEMVIECHGFDNEFSYEKLKTHEFLGAMIPEAQSLPWNIITTAIERCGRWRAADLVIEKEINGQKYLLSGQSKLCVVLIDINIPPRPHALYDEWYDKKDRSNIPFCFFTPPQPIIPVPITDRTKKSLLDQYPTSVYQGKQVVWVPNPKAYNFTCHFEELDENRNKIPWSGYNYWLRQVYRDDSAVTRYIIGKPDTVSGDAAIYRHFQKNEETVCRKPIKKELPVWVGFDPGGHSAFICMQFHDGAVHFFKEFIFTLADNLSTREQINGFLIPYCEEELTGMNIVVVPDPASAWLGKSRMSDTTESALNVLQFLFKEWNRKGKCKYRVELPRVRNQETDVRIESLKYFINQHKISIDPMCETFIDGLLGGYHYKVTKSKLLSGEVDKSEPSCDVVEAAQYPLVNILKNFNREKRYEIQAGQARQGSLRRW